LKDKQIGQFVKIMTAAYQAFDNFFWSFFSNFLDFYTTFCRSHESNTTARTVYNRSRRITFMASTEGGVEIEKVAEETPEKIIKVEVDPLARPSKAHAQLDIRLQQQ
jgi:hypothetical protein